MIEFRNFKTEKALTINVEYEECKFSFNTFFTAREVKNSEDIASFISVHSKWIREYIKKSTLSDKCIEKVINHIKASIKDYYEFLINT